MLEQEALPSGITERFDALVNYGISGATLYRHRHLWHPRHLEAEIAETNRELQVSMVQDCQGEASCTNNPPNLLAKNGCNALPDEDFDHSRLEAERAIGCNDLSDEGCIGSEPRVMSQSEGIAYIKQVLEQIKVRQQATKIRKQLDEVMELQFSIPLLAETIAKPSEDKLD